MRKAKSSAAPLHNFCGLVHISEEVSPSGKVSVYQYDRNNRLIQEKQTAPQQEEPAERVTEYTYDPAGNLLRAQAGDGKEVMTAVSYEYDALNRVTAVISPAGGRTVYTYDKKTGKISSITDAAGNQRTFRYNILGELTEENLVILLTMTVPSNIKEMTVNLKAPIVINADTRKGTQIIVENQDYEVKYKVYGILSQKQEG